MANKAKLDPNQIKIYAVKAGRFLRRHSIIIFLVSIIGAYSFLIFRINQLSSMEPSDEMISEQLNVIKRPKIDQEAINKIEQLEDQNIGVQTLFQEARDNPFSAE